MHRCVMGVVILALAVLFPVAAQTRSAMDCIQHSEHKFRNLCSKNVVVAWCITDPKEGYNTSQGIVCGEGSSYYGWVQNFPKDASTTSFGWLGGLRWAACFSPKTPVATRGGERFVCRDRRGAGAASPAPGLDEDAPDPAAERRFAAKLCAYNRRALERHRPRCAQRQETSCDIVDAARRHLRRHCR